MPPTFADIGVPDALAAALSQKGIEEPFDIQRATIPDALAGRDICGRAPTGSGKTLAFGIPIVAQVGKSKPRQPQALILAPTRELAGQITKELLPLARARKRTVEAVYGGVSYSRQAKAIRQGTDILVACPGRLEDLLQQGDVRLDDVNLVVIDEADRMADMGFLPPVRRILDKCAKKRQTLLFSATLDGAVAKLTRDYQHDPIRHEVGSAEPDISSMAHKFWRVKQDERSEVTARTAIAMGPTIVFVRTRHGADRLAKRLDKMGVDAVAIHGDRSQNQRERALARFDKGQALAMVATDVAARGVHVDSVAAVVHFDPPDEDKTYVHRSGRTARAGATGTVVSLVQPNQEKDARKLVRRLNLDADLSAPEGLADLPDVSNRPARKPEGSGGGGKNRSGGGGGKRRSGGGGGGGAKNSWKPRKSNGSGRKGKPGRRSGEDRSGGSGPGAGRSNDAGSGRSNGSGSGGSGGQKSGGQKSGGPKSGGQKSNPRSGGPKAKKGNGYPKSNNGNGSGRPSGPKRRNGGPRPGNKNRAASGANRSS